MVGGIRVQKPQGYECGEEKGGEEREGEGTKTRDVYVFPWLALTLTVVSDRRTVNEARVGFLSRREDNVFRGEREGGEEGELALLFLAPSSIGLYRFSASDIVYAHDPGTIGRICVPPGARAGPLPPPLLPSDGHRGKRKKRKDPSWKIIIPPPLDSHGDATPWWWSPSPLNIEILEGGPVPRLLPLLLLLGDAFTYGWIQVSMIFRDRELCMWRVNRGVETPLLFGLSFGESGGRIFIIISTIAIHRIVYIDYFRRSWNKKILVPDFLGRERKKRKIYLKYKGLKEII